MNQSHTPTPWNISTDRTILTILESKVCLPIAFMNEKVHCYEANAAHIVKCVNSHDELVACLQTVLSLPEFSSGQYGSFHAKICNALNQAKGGA